METIWEESRVARRYGQFFESSTFPSVVMVPKPVFPTPAKDPAFLDDSEGLIVLAQVDDRIAWRAKRRCLPSDVARHRSRNGTVLGQGNQGSKCNGDER